jgi:hypothetical protein
MFMRSLKKTIIFSVVAVLCYGLIVSCENPFSNNLGSKVDIEPPTITVTSPVSGDLIHGITRFSGSATAYRALNNVEVIIYNNNGIPLRNWTNLGVQVIGDDPKSKIWYYDVDTRLFPDGFLKFQFRASDVNLAGTTVMLTYIVKNKPSTIQVSEPSDTDLRENRLPEIFTDKEILGQVIDRRGIKPGYPRIKIWPANESEPGAESWVTMFISNKFTDPVTGKEISDDLNKDRDGGTDKTKDWGYYVDRTKQPVIRVANFFFRLAKYDVDPETHQVKYDLTDSGNFQPLSVGIYNFRIMSSETYFYESAYDPLFQRPRAPNATNGEKEMVAYYPEEDKATPWEDLLDNSTLYYSMKLKDDGHVPEIELDFSGISPADLEKVPNIYITEPTMKKTVKSGQPVFHLQVKAQHKASPIDTATIRWEHHSQPSGGFLLTNGVGEWAGTPNSLDGKIFKCTANGGTGSTGFVSSPDPYTLVVTVTAEDNSSSTVRYTLYLDSSGPTVDIQSVMGAATTPTAPYSPVTGADGRVNTDPYVVNGNIQVSVVSNAPMGITSTKWIVETTDPSNASSIQTKLKNYFGTPSADNYKFYDDIKNGILTEGQLMQGLIQSAKLPANDPLLLSQFPHLKFNTLKQSGGTNAWDKQYLWLYIIAEDTFHNLGFYQQRLYVDDSTDVPVLTVPGLDKDIAQGSLFFNTNLERKNILGKYDPISLTVSDDDGILLSDIVVSLTNLYGTPSTQTITVDKSVMTVGTETYERVPNSSQSWTGSLTPQIMARALYGSSANKTSLDDGLYRLDISLKDNDAVKVKILATDENNPPNQAGNNVGAVNAVPNPQTYFFAVRSEEPKVEIIEPSDGQTVSKVSVPISGTVKSPFDNLTSLNIIFTPDVIGDGNGGGYSNTARDLTLTIPTPTYDSTEKLWVYRWSYPNNVNFAPDHQFTPAGSRKIMVSVVDGLGFPSSNEVQMDVDNTPPTIVLNTFNFDRPRQREGDYAGKFVVNGKVHFTVNVFDTGGINDNAVRNADGIVTTPATLVNISWWVLPETADPPTWTRTGTPPALATPTFPTAPNGAGGRFRINAESGNDYSVLLYTGGIGQTGANAGLPKGTYKLYVIAEDNAGNISSAVELREFVVDQDYDYPILDEVTPRSGFINTITSGGLRIEGTVSDDDGFSGGSTANVSIRFPTSVSSADPPVITWPANWTAVSTTKAGAGGDLEFTYTPPSGATYPAHLNGDGSKYYQIRVTDVQANKNPTAPDNNTGPAGPALPAVSKIFPSDGTAIANAYSFTIKNNPPQIYFINYDPTTGHPNYSASRPTYKDAGDMVDDLTGGYVLDDYLDTSSLSIIYTSNGTSGLASVILTPIQTGNKYEWDLTAVRTSLVNHFGSGKSGTHTITIVAADLVGGISRVEWTFAKDTEGPVISGPSGKIIKDETTVNGTFYDELSPIYTAVAGNPNQANETFSYRFYSSGATAGTMQTDGIITPDTSDANRKRANWILDIPDTLPDGDCILEIEAADTLGNSRNEKFTFTLDRNAPLVSPLNVLRVSGASIPGSPKTMVENERVFSASETEPSGTVVFTLSGMVYERNLTELSATINPGGGGTPILRELKGKDETTQVNFVDWVKTGTGPYPSATATFRIRKASTGDRTTYLAGATTSDIYVKSENDEAHLYVWELVVDRGVVASLTDLDTGSNTPGQVRSITVMARDIAQRNSVRDNWRFYLDSEKPTVTFLNANWKEDNTYVRTAFEKLNLQGTIEDDTYVQSLKFTLAKWVHTGLYSEGAWRYWTGSAWSGTAPVAASWVELLSSTGKNLTWTLNEDTLNGNSHYVNNPLKEQGRYKIDLGFTDYSLAASEPGNPGTKSLEFYIDNTPPKITWLSTQKEFYRSDDLTFTLKAEDINSIRTPSYVLRLSNATGGTSVNAEVTAHPSGNPPVNEFEIDISSSAVTSGQRYTLVMTVTDESGNVAVSDNTLTFLVDDTKPEITVSPAADIAIVGRVEFQGKFNKSGSLSPVSRVAFRATSGTVPDASVIQSAIKGMNSTEIDTYLKAQGWVFNTNTPSSDPYLYDGSTKLMEIDGGLATAKLLLYVTSKFGTGDNTFLKDTGPLLSTLKFDGRPIPSDAKGHTLPLYFLAIDEAGNVQVLSQPYYIYPDGDLPVITAINNPNDNAAEAERLMNGTIRISGTAVDNVRVKNVWFRVIDKEPASPTFNQPITTLSIPEWDTETWDPKNTPVTYQGPVSKAPYDGAASPGWYMANGGGSKSVAWWAYINNNGELNPSASATERKIEIQVMAEDTRLNSDGDAYETGNGLFPRAANSVVAKVVQSAPRFGDEWVKLGPSTSTFGEAGGWSDISDINITKRSAYALVIQHEMGLGAIRWNRGGSESTVNLLDKNNTYNTTTYTTNLNGMNAATPTGEGIAVKAVPRTPLSGNIILVPDKVYMIWEPHASLDNLTIKGDPNKLDPKENVRYTRFEVSTNTNINLGTGLDAGVLLEQTSGGVFEWVVVVDLYTTRLAGWTGRADWFPLNLSASEISKSVPLSASYSAQIPIDNITPVAAYTHNTNVIGSATTFGGEAGDGGIVKGVSKIVLWFSRQVEISAGNYAERSIPWDEKRDPLNVPAFESGDTPTDITFPAGVTMLPGVEYPKTYNASDTSGNRSSIVIDQNDPLGSQSRYGHNLYIGFAPGGGLGTNWYVTLDSTYITSGRVYAHYLVYDKAGNVSYFRQKLMILNGRPKIANITLATDIRGGAGLGLAGALVGTGTNTNNLANGGANITAPTNNFVGGARGSGDIVKRIKDRFIERVTGISDTSLNTAVGISDEITINTDRLNDYDVVYDNTFTVRNNLLAARVATLVPQSSGKTRSFRFEYVQNVRRIEGATIINATTGIRAGRMYIIADTGDPLFPWSTLGVQGEAPRRGLAFVAMEDGNVAIPTWNVANFGTPAVWELNSSYYSNATNPLARTYPANQANLSLSDVTYPNTGGDGLFAEFVYQANAFGANRIVEYNPREDTTPALSDFNADGRPKPYPFPTVVNGTQQPHAAHSLFIVRVFDGNESELFGDFALLSIRVNNNDRTKPYAQMYDLNPKTEGVDIPQTKAEALSPGTSIGGNRAKGGLYNENERNTSLIAKSGHIEPRTGTSLTSSEMGGAVSTTAATMQKPFANAGAYFDVDTVSGNVVVRGYAEDDTRVGRINLEISYGTGTQTLSLLSNETNPATWTTGTKFPAVGFMRASAQITDANNISWTEALDLNRHRVEFAYVWNAESVTNTPVGNISLRVVASNTNTTAATSEMITRSELNATNRTTFDYYNPTFPSANSPASTGNFYRYNNIRVNLRPYITGFMRNKTDLAHDTRSRQGRYMFAQGETVVVKGFNLGGATNPIINLPPSGTNPVRGILVTTGNGAANGVLSAAGRTAFGLASTDTGPASRYRIFTVPASTATYPAVTGHGMVTYDIESDDTIYYAVNTSANRVRETTNPIGRSPTVIQPWNVEYSTGVLGSDLWDDFTMIHIWQSNDTAPGAGTTNNSYFRSTNDNWPIMNPAMSIEPGTGILHASHTENGTTWNPTLNGNTGGPADGNGGTLKTSTNSGNAAVSTPLIQFIDPIISSDIYYSPGDGTVAAARWAVSSIIGQAGNWPNFANMGGVYINGPGGTSVNLSGDGIDDTSNGTIQRWNNVSLYYGESTWYNASLNANPTTPRSTDQFLNPHIVTSYDGGFEYIHVSYYDSKDGSIKYRYNRRNSAGTITTAGNVNTTTANANAIPKVWTNLDGGYDAEDTAVFTANATTFPAMTTTVPPNSRVVNFNNNNNSGARPVTARTDGLGYTGNNVGEHNAIAVTSQGYPVIAYYDADDQKLKLAISGAVNPVDSRNWIIVDVLPEGNPYKFATGQYVSIAIDQGRAAPAGGTNNVQANRIHIAAMNINGNLVYIRGQITPPSPRITTTDVYTATGGSFVHDTVQVIDSVGTVGRWCKISLDEYGNPWIAYQDDGYIGARDGAKIAYLNTDRFTKGRTTFAGEDIDLNGTSISGWETMHIPTQFRVENPSISGRENGRIGMECFPTRNYPATGTQFWGAAVSYLTTFPQTRYRIAYYVK